MLNDQKQELVFDLDCIFVRKFCVFNGTLSLFGGKYSRSQTRYHICTDQRHIIIKIQFQIRAQRGTGVTGATGATGVTGNTGATGYDLDGNLIKQETENITTSYNEGR